MPNDKEHRTAERFDFELARRTAVIICKRVKEGAPIVHAAHDGDGDWQFLCGGEHTEDGPDEAVVACLECIVAGDPSLNEVADLRRDWCADRDAAGATWKRRDHFEDSIKDAVEEHGWFVVKIEAGDSADEPPFAYTVGLYKTHGHPEVVCVGLPTDVMHGMLNNLGELIKAGQKPSVGAPFGEVLDDYQVKLREVSARESYDEHVGYAIWFHGGREFPLVQLVWPDKQGRFPGDPESLPAMATRQPLLP